MLRLFLCPSFSIFREDLLLGLHVGINSLNIIEFFQLLYHLLYGLALFCCHFLQIVGDAGKLSTCHLKSFTLEMFLNVSKALGITIDGDFA